MTTLQDQLAQMSALLQAQTALLAAICHTYPDRERLKWYFERYAEGSLQTSDAFPEVGGRQQAWNDLFRAVLCAPESPASPQG